MFCFLVIHSEYIVKSLLRAVTGTATDRRDDSTG